MVVQCVRVYSYELQQAVCVDQLVSVDTRHEMDVGEKTYIHMYIPGTYIPGTCFSQAYLRTEANALSMIPGMWFMISPAEISLFLAILIFVLDGKRFKVQTESRIENRRSFIRNSLVENRRWSIYQVRKSQNWTIKIGDKKGNGQRGVYPLDFRGIGKTRARQAFPRAPTCPRSCLNSL